ncbi:MAG: hypothetical protein ACLFQK_10405 [Fibrobacterota bacterium]
MRLFIILAALMLAAVNAANVSSITDGTFKDGYSDRTTFTYDFPQIEGDFLHTQYVDNNLAFIGSKSMGSLKPFIDFQFIPGAASQYFTDFDNEENNTGLNQTITNSGEYSDISENNFYGKFRVGTGLDLGSLKLGFALVPILSKNNLSYKFKSSYTETAPNNNSNYTVQTEEAEYNRDNDNGSLGIQAGGITGPFGFHTALTIGGTNNDFTYDSSATETDYTYDVANSNYTSTTTVNSVETKAVDPAGADENTAPGALETDVSNMSIPATGYGSTNINAFSYFSGMSSTVGTIFSGINLYFRSYDPEKSSWMGKTAVGNTVTTAQLSNSWDVKSYNNLNIYAMIKKKLSISEKLRFGYYPRLDIYRNKREADFTLMDETTPGTVIQGDKYSYEYSYLGFQLSSPLAFIHETSENISMIFCLKPALMLSSNETVTVDNNSAETTTAGGTSTSPDPEKTENTTRNTLTTSYGSDFANFGLNWKLSDNVVFGAYASAGTATMDIATVRANITLHR